LLMEASVNPSYRRLRPEKWEASPDRAGSSHIIQYIHYSVNFYRLYFFLGKFLFCPEGIYP
ncbi:hypothetical protein, partial [Yersinia enterocolitica]